MSVIPTNEQKVAYADLDAYAQRVAQVKTTHKVVIVYIDGNAYPRTYRSVGSASRSLKSTLYYSIDFHNRSKMNYDQVRQTVDQWMQDHVTYKEVDLT